MASVMETFNASGTATPHNVYATIEVASPGFLNTALDSSTPLSIFTAFLAVFLAAVVYDQCMCNPVQFRELLANQCSPCSLLLVT